MIVRIFEEANGHLRIFRPNMTLRNEGETEAEFIDRIGKHAVENDPSLAGLGFHDVEEADIPTDRTHRHKWRLDKTDGKKQIKVDHAVPDRPHPRQAVIDEINAAKDVAELKEAMLSYFRRK